MSRNTPTAIARQLRQEAGFGCCVCGLPIIQYHHIVEWNVEEHFRAEDMMALCPTHHSEVTHGGMPESNQRYYKSNPFNIKIGRVKGFLKVWQDYCAVEFGTITVVNEGNILDIEGENVLSMNVIDGCLSLTLRMFDKNSELIAEIVDNEWTSGDPMPWDIEAKWQQLTLRRKDSDISLNIDAKSVPMRVTAKLWHKGHYWTISKNGLEGGTSKGEYLQQRLQLSGFAIVGCSLNITKTETQFNPMNGNGVFIVWPDHRQRLYKAKDAWLQIKRDRCAK